MSILADVSGVAAGVIGFVALGAGAGIGIVLAKMLGAKSLANAQAQAKQTIESAQAEAKTCAEKIRLDAEKSLLERKTKAEEELEKGRSELREIDRRLSKREDLFDRKEESLVSKEQALNKAADSMRAREERMSAREAEVEQVMAQQTDQLQRVAGMPPEQAREMLLAPAKKKARHDVAKVVRKTIEDAEHEAKEKAREITLMAIQRYASEHTSESTVR